MGGNLLIIEADTLFRKNLAWRLESERFHIASADHETNVKKIIKKGKIDVALLSLNNFKREGLGILKSIKKIRPIVEVITINNPDQIELSIEGMRLGAFDDFILPFEMDSFIRRIKDACSYKKKREKTKKSIFERCQDIFAAASFAEADEAGMALDFLKERKKSKRQINLKKQSD